MLVILLLLTSLQTHAFPETPPNACYEGCTPRMQEILNAFGSAHQPSLEPAVYSGECYHLSSFYDPNQKQFGTMMIDHDDQNNGLPYFAMTFSFFLAVDDSASWNLKTAEANMNPEWKQLGKNILVGSNTARVEVVNADGSFGYIYWMRQGDNGSVYQITYAGGLSDKVFCELKKH